MNLDRREGLAAFLGLQRDASRSHGLEFAAHEEVHVLPGEGKPGPVKEPDCSRTQNCDTLSHADRIAAAGREVWPVPYSLIDSRSTTGLLAFERSLRLMNSTAHENAIEK